MPKVQTVGSKWLNQLFKNKRLFSSALTVNIQILFFSPDVVTDQPFDIKCPKCKLFGSKWLNEMFKISVYFQAL
jgi:hypothetical protein